MVYRPWSAFNFRGRHVDDDKISAIQVENGDGTGRAGIYTDDLHIIGIASPFYLVCPVRCTHFAFGDILCVPRLKRLVTRRTFRRTSNALLAEADRLYLIAFLGHNNVALGRVTGRALRLVEAANAGPFEAGIFLHFFLVFFFAIFIGLPLSAAAFLAAALPLAS